MNRKWRELLRGVLWIFLAGALAAMPVKGKETTQQIYKSKCQICHGGDGSPTVAGKSMGARDLRSQDVQKETDTQLTEIIAKGKNKMPAYENSLTKDQIKDLVAYVRDLAKKGK
jgi:mono/diheme cytochrome c family protein